MMANRLTLEEQRIIRSYILLPFIRTALAHDRKAIGLTNVRFKTQYLAIIDAAVHQVTDDIRKNREELFEHHIRMTRRSGLEYDAYTRGYLFEIGYHKSVAAAWIQEHIALYMRTGFRQI